MNDINMDISINFNAYRVILTSYKKDSYCLSSRDGNQDGNLFENLFVKFLVKTFYGNSSNFLLFDPIFLPLYHLVKLWKLRKRKNSSKINKIFPSPNDFSFSIQLSTSAAVVTAFSISTTLR